MILFSRLKALFRRKTLDADMAEEMQGHLERRTLANLAGGMSPNEAREAAERQFGGMDQLKENVREQRGMQWIEHLVQDSRYAIRQLRGSPGFTVTAVLTLAVGIGANTALFTLGNAWLFRGPAGDRPHELVSIFFGSAERSGTDNHSYPDYLDYRDGTVDVLSGLAAFTPEKVSLVAMESTERICAGFVSDNYFPVMGVSPLRGRVFFPQENVTPGMNPVAMISEGLWRRRFDAGPQTLGRTISLNGNAYTIVGIVPDFATRMLGALKVDVFVPAVMRHDGVGERGNKEFMLLGRLRPGVSEAEAQTRFNVLASQLARQHPREWTSEGRVKPLTVVAAGNVPFGLRGYAMVFFASLLALVGVVLLIVCANLAGLLLARGAARRREIAVRLALGASRGRIVRQLLTESLLLALWGGALSIPLALGAVRALTAFTPDLGVPLLVDVGLDLRVLGFNLAVSFGAAVVFGFAPALQTTKPEVACGLNGGEFVTVAGRRMFSLRNLLVVAQVAASIVLLLGAGMFLRSMGKLSSIKLGFSQENLALLSVDLSLHGYSPERVKTFYAAAVDRLTAIPGVESVEAARRVPIGFDKVGRRLVPEGSRVPAEEATFGFNVVGPRYFATMQIPLLAGRGFGSEDREGTSRVAVINETMAQHCWPGENPIGRRLLPESGAPIEVVGVCRTGKYHQLGERAHPFVYLPWAQEAAPAFTLHVRTRGDAANLLGTLRQELLAFDRGVSVFDVKTMTDHLAISMLPIRLGATLFGIFGGLALALASLGLYGLMAYMVTQRTREIGIRLALGALRSEVLVLILRSGLKLTLAGVGCGLAIGASLIALISSQLYGLSGGDVLAFVELTATVLCVAAMACWIPARGATQVDPVVALRVD